MLSVWSRVIYVSEIRTVYTTIEKRKSRLEAFEMWCYIEE